jgi:hypothetical protein
MINDEDMIMVEIADGVDSDDLDVVMGDGGEELDVVDFIDDDMVDMIDLMMDGDAPTSEDVRD